MTLPVLISIIAICVTLIINIIAFAFLFGKLSQRVTHLEGHDEKVNAPVLENRVIHIEKDVSKIGENIKELFANYDKILTEVGIITGILTKD
jgi:hypothetical protein